MLRVIAGEKKHLHLETVSDMSIRPTTDRIKETLFNMIQFDISGIRFLDLFAGCGAIGIEALSRGALHATFVDNNIEAIKVIKNNLSHTGLSEKATVIKRVAIISIAELENKGEKFDIIFMDPPYADKLYLPVLKTLLKTKICDENTMIIIEMDIKDDIAEIEKIGYTIYKNKEYKTNKHIFVRKAK